jgi:hypothetical protein
MLSVGIFLEISLATGISTSVLEARLDEFFNGPSVQESLEVVVTLSCL